MIAIIALSFAFSYLASIRHPTTSQIFLALPVPFVAAIASYGIIITVPDPVIRLHAIFYGLPVSLADIRLSHSILISAGLSIADFTANFVAVYPSTAPRIEARPLDLMV